MRTKNAVLNVLFTLLKQLAAAVSGLILPRLLMGQYGSEANGLVGSITQFLSYISLMEAGVGGVISASLYKPLYQNDMRQVSGVIEAAKRFYHKIGLMAVLYILALCALYPLIIKSSFDAPYVVSLILILAIGTLAQYFVSLPYMALIKASQRLWLISLFTILTTTLTLIASVILIELDASIHAVKGAACAINLLNPLLMTLYVRKKFALPKAEPDNHAIQQRWNGLGHHLAFFIHMNTDIAVLSLFMDLVHVSVYMVYRSVLGVVQSLILSVSESCSAAFGDLLAEGNAEKTNHNFDRFEFVQTGLSAVLYTITFIMIIPFIRIYTRGIHDADYVQPAFAAVIILAETIYCIRLIYSTVLLSANLYKETQSHAWAEAGINIILSVLLVRSMGLVGIAVGTLMGTIVRGIFDARYLCKNLLHRPIRKTIRLLSVSLAASLLSVFCTVLLPLPYHSWLGWAISAACVSAIVVCIFSIAYLVFYRKQMNDMLLIAQKIIRR